MATTEPTTEPTSARTVLPGRPPFTVDDLLKFPDDGNRYELFNGSLLVSPAPTSQHQLAITFMMEILLKALPGDLIPLTTINLKVSDKDFLIPDLVVVPRERARTAGLMFTPSDVALAVEIVSPSTKLRDRAFKTEAYAAVGIPSYWRVELGEGPVLYVYDLVDGDVYGPPAVHKAGTVAELAEPFPVSFDPAELS
ncbi:Uma2 family endonuclease [Nonomuraea sp. MCN248]|uniref:Uma2 family endonuclease n=1 Tax=Nonomuraea corallina TaxID=2989783 RepID=A0ABT4SKI5_9ACTN|nr:Uma2 family endonuclease [Nonomuraea corallina]MDA0637436.1 Uma2 family endonuclease [Nonomuraea corallina]